jgi:hypothetical protein
MSLEVIQPPTKEVLEKVRSEFGLNEQRIKEAIEHIRDWLELQPHLPKEIGTFGKHILNTPKFTPGFTASLILQIYRQFSCLSLPTSFFEKNKDSKCSRL